MMPRQPSSRSWRLIYNLGYCCSNGHGVKVDKVEAAKLNLSLVIAMALVME